MPRRNGTGPMGMGKTSGWGMEPCAVADTEVPRPRFGMRGLAGRGCGFGRGLGRGRSGRGMMRGLGWQAAEAVKAAQGPSKEALADQVNYLESLLKDAKANLERLKSEGQAQ